MHFIEEVEWKCDAVPWKVMRVVKIQQQEDLQGVAGLLCDQVT